jgi:hypothetical protein
MNFATDLDQYFRFQESQFPQRPARWTSSVDLEQKADSDSRDGNRENNIFRQPRNPNQQNDKHKSESSNAVAGEVQ